MSSSSIDDQEAVSRVLSLVTKDQWGTADYREVASKASADDVRAYLSSGAPHRRDILSALFNASDSTNGERFYGLLAAALCESVVAWALGAQSNWCEWRLHERTSDRYDRSERHAQRDRYRISQLATATEWSTLLTNAGFAPMRRAPVLVRIVSERDVPPNEIIELLLTHVVQVGGPFNSADAISTWTALGEDDTKRLNHLETLGHAYSSLVRAILESGHPGVWQALERRWEVTDDWKRQPRNLAGIRANAPARAFAPARLVIGYECGLWMDEEQRDPTREALELALTGLGFVEVDVEAIDAFVSHAELWACLRKLARYEAESYKRRTELTALRPRVAAFAVGAPATWAEALRWILARAGSLAGCAEAITLSHALNSGPIRDALNRAAADPLEAVRDRSRGIQAAFLGLEAPTTTASRQLLTFVARMLDGTPCFPHPLSPISATWLTAYGVERELCNGIRRAVDRFGSEVRDQGADIEEALTKALVKEIEAEFRTIQPKINLLGKSASDTPVLSLRQRPSTKKSEEPIYGCDLALLLDARVRGHFQATWAEFIQVKKSHALQDSAKKRSRSDSWEIDCAQLDGILKWSATAAYWFIASAGELLVVPARYLAGIRLGSGRSTTFKSFEVGYHDIRSVSIPLEQYLVELLMGQWVGASSADVIHFASGEHSTIKPRLIVEIKIAAGYGENEG